MLVLTSLLHSWDGDESLPYGKVAEASPMTHGNQKEQLNGLIMWQLKVCSERTPVGSLK